MRIVQVLLLFLHGLFSIHNCNADSRLAIFYVTTEANQSTVTFFNGLKKRVGGNKVDFKLINIDSGELKQQDSALYIAVGNRSFKHLLGNDITSPILAVFISRLSFQRILETYNKDSHNKNLSAVFSDPSPLQQLYLVRHLFPNGLKSAVIISKRTAFLEPELRAASKTTGIPLQISMHAEHQNISETLHDIEFADVLLALPDSSIYNADTIQNIILSAYRRNQSIIGFSRQFVEAGGLATVYADTNHIQEEVIDILGEYISKGLLRPPTYPRLFDIEINERVSNSYDLVLPSKSAIKNDISQSLGVCCEK